MTERQPAASRELLRLLGTYRRRLQFLTFTRSLLPCLAAVCAGLVTLGVVVPFTPRHAVLSVGWSAALVIVTAVAIALARTPSLRTTAEIVDARLGLANLSTTALQFSEQEDSVSRLVVASANERLSAHAPKELSAHAPSAIRWLMPALVSCVVVAALFVTKSPSPRLTPQASTSAAAGDRVVAGQQAAAQNAAAASSADSRAPRRETTASAVPQPNAAARTSEHATGSEQRSVPETGDSSAPTASSQSGDATTRRAAETTRAEHDGGLRRDGASDRSGKDARSVASSVADSHRGGRSAASADRPVIGWIKGAGGVDGATPARDRSFTASAPAESAAYVAEYRAGAARAESAVARARVATEVRTLVRDYFMAIRPASQR